MHLDIVSITCSLTLITYGLNRLTFAGKKPFSRVGGSEISGGLPPETKGSPEPALPPCREGELDTKWQWGALPFKVFKVFIC